MTLGDMKRTLVAKIDSSTAMAFCFNINTTFYFIATQTMSISLFYYRVYTKLKVLFPIFFRRVSAFTKMGKQGENFGDI